MTFLISQLFVSPLTKSIYFCGIEMAKVKALYSYAYDYEGSKISFNCGDEFQLLAKVNNDWWHVRRWLGHCSQDIYIPAVYVKEVGDDTNPLYQNMDELKKQVEDFKKKASSTPPPPTARKPKLDRAGSDKSKAAPAARTANVGSPEHKTETESVADRAKKIAENLQAIKLEEEFVSVPRAGSVSMLVAPKRSQSTRREEDSSSPKIGQKTNEGGGPVANVLAVASKPRSRSINVRPGEQRDKDSASPPDLHRGDPTSPGKSLTAPAKGKLPPPVLPKGGKISRPKSMVIVTPGEGPETEETFTSALQSQLTEQLKKQRSGATVVTAATSTSNGEQKTSQQEDGWSIIGKVGVMYICTHEKPCHGGARQASDPWIVLFRAS